MAEIKHNLEYHYILATSRNICVFSEKCVQDSLIKRIHAVCEQKGVQVTYAECNGYICVVGVKAPPELSPSSICNLIKSVAPELMEEYPKLKKMQHLWRRDYYVSITEPSGVTIRDFAVELMKKEKKS